MRLYNKTGGIPLKALLRNTILILCMLASGLVRSNQPLDAPVPLCIEVLPNGDVTIHWQQVADPFGVFDHYSIHDAASGTELGQVPGVGNTSFTVNGAGANGASQSFYLYSRSNPVNVFDSQQGPTISSIYLQVNNPNNGTALLSWNKPFGAGFVPAGTGSYFRIYKESPPGTWSLIDSVAYSATPAYTDTIYTCNGPVNYRIELVNSTGCTSVSNVDGDVFVDILPPYSPDFVQVTVDTATGHAVLNWDQNQAPDTEGYIILQNIPGSGWIPIDTVYGIANTTYTNTNGDASASSELYTIAAIDDCWTGIPLSPNTSPAGDQHRTIFLEGTTDMCARTITLQWNKYENWTAGVNRYEVYISSGGPFTMEASLPAGTNSHTTGILTPGMIHQFVVLAVAGDGTTSLSNKLELLLDQPPVPAFNYFQNASVVGNTAMNLTVNVDQLASVSGVRIERSKLPGSGFTQVGYAQFVTNPIEWTDQQANPADDDYYYRAIVLDSCGNDGIMSNTLRTMHLTATPDQNLQEVDLAWNGFEGWDGNVSEYRIYRSVNEVWDPMPVAVLSASARSYIDAVGNLTDESGTFCYRIEAVEFTNAFGIQETSLSNSVCVEMEPLVYIPNAFYPAGINAVFQPIIGYAELDSYRLLVFNRWGEKVFETDDPAQGWDGTFNSRNAPAAVYVYQVSFFSAGGKEIIKRGSVTLIR